MAPPKDPKDELRALERKLKDAEERRDYVSKALKHPAMVGIVKKLETEVKEKTDELKCIKKKDLDRAQADIVVTETVLARFRNAYASDVAEAKQAVHAFKSKHELFLAPDEPKDAKSADKPPTKRRLKK